MSQQNTTATAKATRAGTAIGVLFAWLVLLLIVVAGWYMLCVVLTPLGGGDLTSDYAARALRMRETLLYFGLAAAGLFGGVGLRAVVRRL